ncbi:MAG TPA: glycosyltransferase [Candidatus Acidoferrum sp.]|nr:glycosyltransferase [Candidatus Acidoferrum sp.]
MKRRFSILMPVYNREKYVGQAIDSVLAQTYKDYEVFAVDDGSTDLSAAVLASYGTRINLLQQSNQGPEVARNKAAALACGEYLVFLDSDDYLFPFALETIDKVISRFGSPTLIMGSMERFDGADGQLPAEPVDRTIRVIKYADYLSKTRPVGTMAIVVRKSDFDAVGGLRNTTAQTWHCDDNTLLLKVGARGQCILIESPCTSAYRQHAENSTKNAEAFANGLIKLADSERQGAFGGKERKADRYAYIGGRAAAWAFYYCWKAGHRKLALKLLGETAPMVSMAVLRRFLRTFHTPEAPIVLEGHRAK